MSSSDYYLLWKGRQSGPFSLAAIREQLAAGDINRMHQVSVGGRWIILGEFLDQQDGRPLEARRRAEATRRQAESAPREEQLRRETERTQQVALRERLHQDEKRSPLSHLVPREPSTEAASPAPPSAALAPALTDPAPPRLPGPSPLELADPFAGADEAEPTRTSGLAIAALVLSICNLIPYLNFITWILAIIFGHVSLAQMNRDPRLGGRQLALGALIITYSLVALAVVIGLGWLAYQVATGHPPHL